MNPAQLLAMVNSKQKSMERHQRAAKMKMGRNTVRILPGWRKVADGDENPFWHDFGQHFIKDETGETKAVYICTEKTFGRPCNICSEVGVAIKSSKDDKELELFKEAKAGERILVNALLAESDAPNEPTITELAPTAFRDFLALFKDWGDLTSASEGRDVIITRTGNGINTKYTVAPSPTAKAVPPAVIAKLHDLDAYVAQESNEQQNKAILAFRQVAGMLSAPAAPRVPASDLPLTPLTPETMAPLALTNAADQMTAAALTRAAEPRLAEPVAVAAAGRSAETVALDLELDALLEAK